MTEFEIDKKTIILHEELNGLLKIMNCFLTGKNVTEEVSDVLHDISNHDLSNFQMKSTLYKSLYCSSFNFNQTHSDSIANETTLNSRISKIAKIHDITLKQTDYQQYLHQRLQKLCSKLYQLSSVNTIRPPSSKREQKSVTKNVVMSPQVVSYMLDNPGGTPADSREDATHLSYNMTNQMLDSKIIQKHKSKLTPTKSFANISKKSRIQSIIDDRLFETNDLESDIEPNQSREIDQKSSIKKVNKSQTKSLKTPLKIANHTLPDPNYEVNTLAMSPMQDICSPIKPHPESEYHTPQLQPTVSPHTVHIMPSQPVPSPPHQLKIKELEVTMPKTKKHKSNNPFSLYIKPSKNERANIIRAYKRGRLSNLNLTRKKHVIKPKPVIKEKEKEKKAKPVAKSKAKIPPKTKKSKLKPKKKVKSLYSEIKTSKNIIVKEQAQLNESVTFNHKPKVNTIKQKSRKRKLINSPSVLFT